MSNIIDKIQVSGVTYDIGGSGGGKAISGGTNISVTTGETTDTVSCTLPIYFNSNDIKGDIAIGTNLTGASSSYHNLLIGRRIEIGNESTSNKNIGIGFNTNSNTSTTYRNTIYGANNVGIGANFEIGTSSYNRNNSCVVIGVNAKSKIDSGVAIGVNAVASGTTKTNINNQLTIDTSNQVYIYNKDNTEMICLQDALGGGGASYTAGDGIDITNNVISVTGKVDTTTYNTYTAATDTALASKQTTLTAGTGINITDNVISSTGGNPTVELTQAEYDALVTAGTVSADTYYIITDAQGGDLSNYWTTAQTQSVITEATSGLQETLVSGTNIKTINNQSLLGSGNIDIQGGGGGVNVVQTTGTSTTDVMSQDAVTTQLNGKADKTTAARGLGYGNKSTHSVISLTNQNGQQITGYYYTLSLSKINGKDMVTQGDINPNTFSLVETSAITTSVTSSSTDAQVPSAKAVYDIVGDIETLLSQI